MQSINEQIEIIKDNISILLNTQKLNEKEIKEYLLEIRCILEEIDTIRCNEELKNIIQEMIDYTCIGDCIGHCANHYSKCLNGLNTAIYGLEQALDRGIVQCNECECYDFIENCIEYGGEFYCNDCSPTQEYTLTSYHDYEIKNKTNSPYTIGIELETEYDSKINTDLVADKIQSNFIASYDGSLNNGIEFVSHVYDLKNLDELKNDLKDLTEQIKDNNGYCHNSTRSGLHIHVSKASFKNIKNLFEFVNQNKDFFLSIGGRMVKPEAYKYCLSTTNNYINDEEVTTRYALLNINNKYDTIEFRFFNSTLNTNTLTKRLDFIKTLKEFENQNNLNNTNILDFIIFVKTHDNELYQFIIKWYKKRIEPIRNKILKK